jgi:hypothetical protein
MKTGSGLIAISKLRAGTSVADDSTGCGAGTVLFDGQSGVAPQVLAVTINGNSGNQTFGFSSGMLGCDSEGTIVASAEINKFASENLGKRVRDMAIGEGEALTTWAV